MRARWSGLSLIFASMVWAQDHAQTAGPLPAAVAVQLSSAKPPVDVLVDQLVENAAVYRATLPSISAHESIQSEASRLIFHTTAKAEAVMRVVHDPVDGHLEESRQITVMNGKPVGADQHPNLPMTLYGGFGGFQDEFFSPSQRGCFRFTLMPQARPDSPIELGIRPNPDVGPACGSVPKTGDLTGVARVDAATHQLMHVERTIPANIAEPRHLAPFASVDLAPTTIGGATFWLPTTVVGTLMIGKVKGEMGDLKGKFEAHYSDYHRFAATATILPIQ